MKRKNNFFIPAGIFLGLGIGMIFKEPAAGLLIGLGIGFLFSALFPLFQK